MAPQMLKGGALPGLSAMAVVILSLEAGVQSEKGAEKTPVADAITESLAWAYPKQLPRPAGAAPSPRAAPDPTLRPLPGSALSLTRAQIDDPHTATEWYLDGHPPAPEVTLRSHGKREACAHCHLPNGLGAAVIQAPAQAAYAVPREPQPRKGNPCAYHISAPSC